jgi:TonB family protein
MNRLLLAAVLLAAPSLAGQDPARVYELSEVEAPPRPANVPELRAALDSTYPAEKRAAGVGARVSVSFVVGTDGVPREVRVTESTDEAFDSVTVGGVGRLRFTPATMAGQPVAVRVEMPITWDASAPVQASADPAVSPTEREVNGERVYAMSEVTVEAKTYEVGEVDETPRPTNTAALLRELERRYPPHLRAHRTNGVVQVRFRVDARGQVIDPIVVTQSTGPEFNTATIEAVRVLRFRPARVDGEPVIVWVELPIAWTVHQAGTSRPE